LISSREQKDNNYQMLSEISRKFDNLLICSIFKLRNGQIMRRDIVINVSRHHDSDKLHAFPATSVGPPEV
jgi:hypothetical protein